MKVKLSPPHFKNNLQVLLEKRYSCRDFRAKALKLEDLSSILWAAGGKKYDATTGATHTVPSAGATYPLELYVAVGQNGVDKLKEGVYHYDIEQHSLKLITEGDKRVALCSACSGQDFIKAAPVSLIIAAQFQRTTGRYGARGEHYVYMEAGHVCQNTYLAVTDLGLGTVEVGAFFDEKVSSALGLAEDYVPLSVMPIGYPR